MHKPNRQNGFTIIELLIVIVIIGILAAITIVAYNGIQTRARDTVRIQDIKTIQRAVEAYHAINGTYPLPAGGTGSWTGECTSYGGTVNYIAGISTVLSSPLPLDPKYRNNSNHCYLYKSDGIDYFIMAYLTMETICGSGPADTCNSAQIQSMVRPGYPNEPDAAVYSPGARLW